MILSVAMTIAGTVPLLVCIILWVVQKNSFHIPAGMRLLKISLFFYLIPVQLLQHALPSVVYEWIYYRNFQPPTEPIRTYYHGELLIPYQEQFIWIPRWMLFVAGCWVAIILIFTFYEIITYRRAIRKLVQASSVFTEEVSGTRFTKLINLHTSAPYSIGFMKSYVVFPPNQLMEDQQKMLYEHELRHIRNHDALMKLLCLAVICVHWFNPFSWLLLFMYSILCEFACDYAVTSCLSLEECRKYAQLLVNLAPVRRPLPFVWKSSFSDSKRIIKRRITYIMKKVKIRPVKTAAMSMITILVVFLSAMTIFAYEPFQTTYQDSWNPKREGDFVELVPETASPGSSLLMPDPVDFSESDTVLVLEDGTQIPIFPENAEKRAACNHSFSVGLRNVHVLQSSGGCKVTQYKVSECVRCGYCRSKTYYGTASYPKCPH